jgi:hypothetical protein
MAANQQTPQARENSAQEHLLSVHIAGGCASPKIPFEPNLPCARLLESHVSQRRATSPNTDYLTVLVDVLSLEQDEISVRPAGSKRQPKIMDLYVRSDQGESSNGVLFPTSMKRYLLALLGVSLYGGDIIDVQEVVRRATSAMQADWAAAPGFAFVQRDLTTSRGVTTSKTHQVFIISGSDYYMPIATDDEPLPADQRSWNYKDSGRKSPIEVRKLLNRRSGSPSGIAKCASRMASF